MDTKNRQTAYDLLEKESEAVLQRIEETHPALPTLSYFTSLARQWNRTITQDHPPGSVVILGTGIPEELILATGAAPLRIPGGSHASCAWSDDLVPRDTDPVTRSILGYLHQPEGPDDRDVLYIIPISSDSMRKTAYQLTREKKNIFAADVPPVRDDTGIARWKEQMVRMTEAVCAHRKARISAENLRRAVGTAANARITAQQFLRLSAEFEDSLSFLARVLVAGSYCWAEDLAVWRQKVEQLGGEIMNTGSSWNPGAEERPGILLMGSPVLFPNGKLPGLFEESGLAVRAYCDALVSGFMAIPRLRSAGRGTRKLLDAVAEAWYMYDSSSAYVKNDAFRGQIARIMRDDRIEGVVFHILKGQVELDFELNYYERFFEELGIPVFRLETDYQYQDVEQLRIRMEAFSEMLRQRRGSVRRAV